PEAAVGGPIGLLRDGDIIAIDADKGTISVELSDAELTERKRQWKPRRHDFQSGALWRYAQTVGDAEKGAVTHPGARAETHVYADRGGPHDRSGGRRPGRRAVSCLPRAPRRWSASPSAMPSRPPPRWRISSTPPMPPIPSRDNSCPTSPNSWSRPRSAPIRST